MNVRGFGRIVFGVLLSVVAVSAILAAYQFLTWPRVSELVTRNPVSTAFIESYSERQRAMGTPDSVEWRWVPDSLISPHVKRAVIAAEDMEFFAHQGISTYEIKQAVKKAVEEGKDLRGASTITQQLAKNLWLSPSRNPWRKVKELLLTRQLEKHLDKQRILELYLNLVEFGDGVYGVEAAAARYFGVSAHALTEREAAMLAASLPRPSTWNPASASDAYAAYVATILDRMDQATFLWRHVGGTPVTPAFDTLPQIFDDMRARPGVAESLPPDTTDGERIYRRPAHEVRNDTSWVG